jgi:type IV pilus assembly protein PilE
MRGKTFGPGGVPRRCRRGFTLVELMIVLAVGALLAAIALPAYQDQVRRTRRTDGTAMLLEVAQAQERWRTRNHTFAGSMTALNYASDSQASHGGFYNVSITVPGGCLAGGRITCFTASAVAAGAPADDTAGQTLTLNDAGVSGPSGCW